MEPLTAFLRDVPAYSYRLGALVVLLAAALYYQLAVRRKRRVDYTVCVAFFLTGAMLAVHPQAEEQRDWMYGMWIAEGVCLSIAVLLAVGSAVSDRRRRLVERSFPRLLVRRGSAWADLGSPAPLAAQASGETVALVPLRYRCSRAGVAVLSWQRTARGNGDPAAGSEEIRMSWN